MKFSHREYRLNFACGSVSVFVTLSKPQREKKTKQNRMTETKEEARPRGANTEQTCCLPAAINCGGGQRLSFCVPEISHPFSPPSTFSFFLRLLPPPAPIFLSSPQFSSHMSEGNERYTPCVHIIPLLTFLFIRTRHLRFTASPIYLFIFFYHACSQQRGRQGCRQIKAETDRYGNLACRMYLFPADSLQGA